MLTKKLLIVIPAYNEEKTISKVINQAKQYGTVLVVNDCSTDKTKKLVESKDVILIDNKINEGYEKSLHKGINYGVKNDYQFCITIDGDGQHKIHFIKTVFEYLIKGYDLVVTNRDSKNRMSEKIIGFCSNLILGIKDPYSGLRGYKLSKINLDHYNMDDSVGLFLTIFMIKNKMKFKEIPIHIEKRKHGVSSFDRRISFINFYLIKIFFNTLLYVKRGR